MEQLKAQWDRLRQALQNHPQWRVRGILLAGIIGILLILLSECQGPQENIPPSQPEGPAQYVRELQERLKSMLELIDGVGQAEVMVTLEHSGETIYAREERRSQDTQRREDDPVGGNLQERLQKEDTFIFTETPDGTRTPLIQKELEPQIRGVVVVCDGGGALSVRQRLIETIRTALHISSSRICVLQRQAASISQQEDRK